MFYDIFDVKIDVIILACHRRNILVPLVKKKSGNTLGRFQPEKRKLISIKTRCCSQSSNS